MALVSSRSYRLWLLQVYQSLEMLQGMHRNLLLRGPFKPFPKLTTHSKGDFDCMRVLHDTFLGPKQNIPSGRNNIHSYNERNECSIHYSWHHVEEPKGLPVRSSVWHTKIKVFQGQDGCLSKRLYLIKVTWWGIRECIYHSVQLHTFIWLALCDSVQWKPLPSYFLGVYLPGMWEPSC